MAKTKYGITGAGARRISDGICDHMREHAYLTYENVVALMMREGIANPKRHVGELMRALDENGRPETAKVIGYACASHCAIRDREHAKLVEALFPFVAEIVDDLKEDA